MPTSACSVAVRLGQRRDTSNKRPLGLSDGFASCVLLIVGSWRLGLLGISPLVVFRFLQGFPRPLVASAFHVPALDHARQLFGSFGERVTHSVPFPSATLCGLVFVGCFVVAFFFGLCEARSMLYRWGRSLNIGFHVPYTWGASAGALPACV